MLSVAWLRLLTYGMLLGALALVVFLGGRQVALTSEAADWQATDGVVVNSWVKASAQQGHPGHPVIVARYTVDGRDHKVSLTPAQGVEGAEEFEAGELVARYPRDATIRVFFDPTQPQIAAFNRRPRSSKLIGAALLLVLALGWTIRTDRQVQASLRSNPDPGPEGDAGGASS